MTLERLPFELLEVSLSDVDWRTLISCREVCTTFRSVIDSSVKLQYHIALGASHMEDGPPSALGPADRLQMLRQYQSNWSSGRPCSDRRIIMEEGGLWELYGNVLAQRDSTDSFKFLQLPAHSRGIEARSWVVQGIDVDPRDFGLDQSQDLLVLVEKTLPSPEVTEFRIHLRTLSTGQPHPLAPKPCFLTHVQNVRNLAVSLTIQSCENYVAVLFHSLVDGTVNQLLVWNWHTGDRKTYLMGDTIRAFSFLGDCYLVLAALHQDDAHEMVLPALKIWDYQSDTGEPIDMHVAPFVRMFMFPEFQSTATLVEIVIRSDPSPQWKPSSNVGTPFHQARGPRIYVVTFWTVVDVMARGINVFIPSRTFLHHIAPSGGSPEVPWEEWGPRGTRLLKSWHDPSSVWVCYSCGEKYVSVIPSGGEFLLVIYDFNDTASRYTASRDLNRKRGSRQPSVYKTDLGVFEEDITTSLMYSTSIFKLERRMYAMCSEDSVVLVNPAERYYRILTF